MPKFIQAGNMFFFNRFLTEQKVLTLLAKVEKGEKDIKGQWKASG